MMSLVQAQQGEPTEKPEAIASGFSVGFFLDRLEPDRHHDSRRLPFVLARCHRGMHGFLIRHNFFVKFYEFPLDKRKINAIIQSEERNKGVRRPNEEIKRTQNQSYVSVCRCDACIQLFSIIGRCIDIACVSCAVGGQNPDRAILRFGDGCLFDLRLFHPTDWHLAFLSICGSETVHFKRGSFSMVEKLCNAGATGRNDQVYHLP